MGLYDVNLKKTNIGYQFDRNVYIGVQTNDNRVVTFKDLGNAIIASGGSGGGGGSSEDIQLDVSSIASLGSSQYFADHIAFKRDGTDVAYDILPQYVRAADAANLTDAEFQSAKACLLVPVLDMSNNVIGYKIYYADATALPTLQMLVHGKNYTYDGTQALAVDFSNKDLSIRANGTWYYYNGSSAVTITLGIGGISTSGTGNAVTSITYSSSNHTLTVTSGRTFLTTVLSGSGISVTGSGATRTIALNATFGSATLTFGGSASYAIVAGVTHNIQLPALPNFTVMGQQLDTSTHTVSAGAGLTVTTSSNTSTVSLDASFNDTTLDWDAPVPYMTVGGTTHYLSLPQIPITTTVDSSSTAAQIPTAQAVYNAITSNISAAFSYDAVTGTLTIDIN